MSLAQWVRLPSVLPDPIGFAFADSKVCTQAVLSLLWEMGVFNLFRPLSTIAPTTISGREQAEKSPRFNRKFHEVVASVLFPNLLKTRIALSEIFTRLFACWAVEFVFWLRKWHAANS